MKVESKSAEFPARQFSCAWLVAESVQSSRDHPCPLLQKLSKWDRKPYSVEPELSLESPNSNYVATPNPGPLSLSSAWRLNFNRSHTPPHVHVRYSRAGTVDNIFDKSSGSNLKNAQMNPKP